MRLNTELREILDRYVEVEAGGVLDAGRDDCLGEVEALLVEALEHVPEVVIFGVNLCARHVVAAEEHAGPLLRGARLARLDDLDVILTRRSAESASGISFSALITRQYLSGCPAALPHSEQSVLGLVQLRRVWPCVSQL